VLFALVLTLVLFHIYPIYKKCQHPLVSYLHWFLIPVTAYIHIHTHTYTYAYIHKHTHTYTYIHKHTHTYTYIHITKSNLRKAGIIFDSQFKVTVKINHHKYGGPSPHTLGVLYNIYETGERQKRSGRCRKRKKNSS
jgi:hypothetical protein